MPPRSYAEARALVGCDVFATLARFLCQNGVTSNLRVKPLLTRGPPQ